MDIDRIEAQVERALEHERDTSSFRDLARKVAKAAVGNVEEEQLDEILQFVTVYVQHVPFFLRQAQTEARRNNIAAFDPILAAAAWYWGLEDDLFPDHLGLAGAIDDAYCSLSLLQGLSNHCQSEAGTPLIQPDLTAANKQMRGFIGEPAASELDTFVTEKLEAVTASNSFADLLQAVSRMGAVTMRDRDPIWGYASSEEIANTRLGAMGIF